EPGAVVPHAGNLCGGRRATGVPTVTAKSHLDLRSVYDK
ncbi:hypothetical protein Ga0451573_003869, partial [Peptococcaceae bacterium DYL19]|nr:hypothetical protein [Phosphitispora fastidiosa]